MVQPRRDIMAQAVYLAQLEAAKGNCKCKVCRIIRKASNAMTEQFLEGDGENPTNPLAKVTETIPIGDEE